MQEHMPLMLLPGLMNDERVWRTVRHAVSGDRTVVCAPTYTADSVSALAAAALALMPVGPFALAGFSLGGYVALEVCRQAPDRIAGIAMLSTGARADPEETRQNRQRMVAALSTGNADLAQVAGAFATRVVHPSHAADPALRELLSEMARHVGGAGFARQQTAAMTRPDGRQLLGTLRCPALVLCGLDDQVTPPALSEEMSGLLAGDVELVVVPECGHMSTLEQPAAVSDALRRWIGRVDAAAGPTSPVQGAGSDPRQAGGEWQATPSLFPSGSRK